MLQMDLAHIRIRIFEMRWELVGDRGLEPLTFCV